MIKKFQLIPITIILTALSCQLSYSQDATNIINRWQHTDTLIRDNKIDKESAIDSLRTYVPLAIDYCRSMNVGLTNHNEWQFPMKGYTSTEYRSNGKDYRDSTFDYFQGAEYHGHPAHDIFILDNDSNGFEDVTGKPVDAIAIVSGLVISVYSRWQPDDMYRSGNYVKLFDPESESIFYYSHLDTVSVKAGQIVQRGEKLGTVGRTGRKAFRGRTHLHIACYKIFNGYPRPVDILTELQEAEQRDKH